MSDKKFIPELHDIGKLVDNKVKEEVKKQIGKQIKSSRVNHVFIDFDFKKFGVPQPTSPSWWGQYHHEKKEINKNINKWNLRDSLGNAPSYDNKYSLFLLVLADHLASSSSRILRLASENKVNPEKEGIVKLWDKEFYESQGKHWAAFRTKEDLKKLFEEIENCSSGEDFLNKYRECLLLTPEDKGFPLNITSLYTHCELVGKFYRVLEKHTDVKKPDGEISIEYNKINVKKIKEAEGSKKIEGKWKARMIKCWIKFPHSFVRLRDINLLSKREKLIENIVKNYPDNVIYYTSDFIFLFLTLNEDLEIIFKEFLEQGFYIEVIEILSNLGSLDSILDKKVLEARKSKNHQMLKVLNNRSTKVYKNYLMPEMPEEISPPICDICQQRRGVEQVKENIKEWICDECNSIRDKAGKFNEYADEWEKEGVKVCWFKFSIDQKKLEEWLLKAFECYIDEGINKLEEKCKDKFNEKLEKVDKVNKLKKLMDYKKGKKEIEKSIDKLNYEIKEIEDEINKKIKKIESLKKIKEESKNIRPLALQVDFNKDYKDALKEFWDEFGREDIKQPISEYDELGVFKYSPKLATEVVKRFIKISEKYFPDCISDKNCPISLSLSIANIKYPVREHWRFFEKSEKDFLNVRYQNVFEDRYIKKELDIIIKNIIDSAPTSSFLHKLLYFERRYQSDIYIAVEIFNNRENYPKIYELFSNEIKPSKFLNLYRVLGGEDIYD
ncbi:hypothetical protein KKP97_06920 [Methanothermococcus sp. SCGC AD-155-C09]|nr:hypothetical protein [Methanothermococcus sp. SCGC AD-155-C09]